MKYKQHIAQEDGWSEWETPVMKGYKLACCDCGLVHNVEFRVLEAGRTRKDGSWKARTLKGKRYRVEFRVSRNNRATGQIRRWMK